jgi:hypothetical protein
MGDMRVRPHNDHIPLHRLWAFTSLQTDLSQREDIHLFGCEECCSLMLACVKARSFVEVFKDADDPPPLALAS